MRLLCPDGGHTLPLWCSSGHIVCVCSFLPRCGGFCRWCTSRPRSHMLCSWSFLSEESPCPGPVLGFGTSSHQSGRNSRMPRWASDFIHQAPTGEQHVGLGPTLGLCLAEGVRPPLMGQLTVSLYKLLMILKRYIQTGSFIWEMGSRGVSDSWNSCPTSGVAVEVEMKNEIPLIALGRLMPLICC